jgi:hypothetical protein
MDEETCKKLGKKCKPYRVITYDDGEWDNGEYILTLHGKEVERFYADSIVQEYANEHMGGADSIEYTGSGDEFRVTKDGVEDTVYADGVISDYMKESKGIVYRRKRRK